jgi:hypothetical protein
MVAKGTEIAPLNSEERSELKRCEKVVDQNRAAFLKVGNALLAIREKKLYRETHGSFSAYVEERHDFKGAWASRLIQTAQVSENLSRTLDTSSPPCLSPDAAAALSKLPKDQQTDAYQDAMEEAPSGKPTIKAIKAKVETYLTDNEPYREEPDGNGESLDDVFDEQAEEPLDTAERMAKSNQRLAALARQLTNVMTEAEGLAETEPWLAERVKEQFLPPCRTARDVLTKQCKGAGTCTYCDGHGCDNCHETGWLPKIELARAQAAQEAVDADV